MTLRKKGGNYYDVLHVSPDAPVEIIRSSYRTLMQQLKNHPDLGGDTTTAALINGAYAVLIDAKRRAEYDALLGAAQQVDADRPGESQQIQAARAPDRLSNPFRECVFCKSPHDRGNVIHANAECAVCGSPLYPAGKHCFESKGRRAIARITKRQDITFYTHWPQSRGFAGHTEDTSLNGMRFVTSETLAEGRYIKIVGDVVEAIGDVVHCSKRRRRGAPACSVAAISYVTVRYVRRVGGFISDRV